MALKEFFDKRREVRDAGGNPLKKGTEVLIISSHVDCRYTSVGIYNGKSSEHKGDKDIIRKLHGYANIILEDTITIPVEVSMGISGLNEQAYHDSIIDFVKNNGTKEGKTSHALDLGARVYEIFVITKEK